MPGKKNKSGKGLLFFGGSVALIVGMTMVLVWWRDVVLLFRGAMGILLALGGMLLLYMAKD